MNADLKPPFIGTNDRALTSRAARILIVDDDALLTEWLTLQLARGGYDCTVAGDAMEALTTAGECAFDLVLMDIMLPGGRDGIDAAGEITQRFGLPVIMLSALHPDDLHSRLLASGAYGFLLKPINEQALRINVALALRHHRAQTELQKSEALYRTLTESSPDGILLSNIEGTILKANSGAETMFGYPPGELTGISIDALVPAESRTTHQKQRAEFDQMQRHGAMRDSSIQGCRRDGSTFFAEVSLGHLSSPGSLLITSTVRDVSKRVDQAAALQRLNRALRLIHDCNLALVRAVGEQEIIDEIGRLLFEQGGYPGVWIDLADNELSLQDAPARLFGDPWLIELHKHTDWPSDVRAALSAPALRRKKKDAALPRGRSHPGRRMERTTAYPCAVRRDGTATDRAGANDWSLEPAVAQR